MRWDSSSHSLSSQTGLLPSLVLEGDQEDLFSFFSRFPGSSSQPVSPSSGIVNSCERNATNRLLHGGDRKKSSILVTPENFWWVGRVIFTHRVLTCSFELERIKVEPWRTRLLVPVDISVNIIHACVICEGRPRGRLPRSPCSCCALLQQRWE